MLPSIEAHYMHSKICIKIHETFNVEQYQYAFYLHFNNEIIYKQWYTDELETEFELDKNGIYFVTVFFKHKTTGEMTTQKSLPTRYERSRTPCSIPFIKIEEMEMTNICNLQCKNCCTPTTGYPKGYIDDETVHLALGWMQRGQTLNYHRHGEPLLHKNLGKYIGLGVDYGVKPIISTNGLLATQERIEELFIYGLRHLVFTLHTPDSLRNFISTYDYLSTQQTTLLHFNERQKYSADAMYFCGKILDFPEDEEQGHEVRQMISAIPERIKPFLQKSPVHNWAGNVPGSKDNVGEDRMNSCYFIKNNIVNMRWDGTIVGCCFDSENENELGHIRDYSQVTLEPSRYNLCKNCNNNWAVQ